MSIKNFMKNNYFQVVRGGLIQPSKTMAEKNLYIGLPFGCGQKKLSNCK